MIDREGLPTDVDPVVFVHDREEFATVVARQVHIVTLLDTVRALAIAIVILFLVFGLTSAAALRSINDTRQTTKKFAREQHFALCDIYVRLQQAPPEEMNC